MNGTKSKMIRREIYGDNSIRNTKYVIKPNGQIVCLGLRKKYQAAKKYYLRLPWNKRDY